MAFFSIKKEPCHLCAGWKELVGTLNARIKEQGTDPLVENMKLHIAALERRLAETRKDLETERFENRALSARIIKGKIGVATPVILPQQQASPRSLGEQLDDLFAPADEEGKMPAGGGRNLHGV